MMDRRVFREWISEDRYVRPDPHGRAQVVFVENAGGHRHGDDVQEVLDRKCISLRIIPPNSTDLCQPADANVIKQLKVWRDEWEKEKLKMAMERRFAAIPNSAGEWSGKLQQPGKRFFLELAASCCRSVTSMRDTDNVSIVRKSTITCGLGQNLSIIWEVRQLFPHLQVIAEKHLRHFDGEEPVDFCEVVV